MYLFCYLSNLPSIYVFAILKWVYTIVQFVHLWIIQCDHPFRVFSFSATSRFPSGPECSAVRMRQAQIR